MVRKLIAVETFCKTTFVIMTAAPTIIAPAEGQQFDIIEDNYLSITCTATGYPEPSVIWKKDANHGSGGYSSRVTSSDLPTIPAGVGNETRVSKLLTMRGVTKEDAGIYRCVASNTIHFTIHSTIVTITVLCKFVGTNIKFCIYAYTWFLRLLVLCNVIKLCSNRGM